MTNEQEILAKALELDAARDRDAFLDKACHGDNELRQRLQVQIDEHFQTRDFLQSTGVDKGEWEFGAGDQIGPYRLLEQVGEGGMGVVYVAEQQKPVRRMVALKVVKPGMDTREVINRFEAERQALALMDHPNIASVFDAGSTENGRPYFVMELVRGIPITKYCDEKKLDGKARLNLFMHVCHAIQHAHQKGIIHRDIKPGNVLVSQHDDRPVVKVIDFGVAKAINQSLVDGTVYTKFSQMIGTPLYMSPEQAELSGLDIDTRTDIYSLGVMLYELLTGDTPFERQRIKEAAFDELRRIIIEEDPPTPSIRISSLGDSASHCSQLRQTDPRQLSRLLKGDLDWIIMKSMDKDRRRRYETANAFAMDINRFLNDEPVLASPPSRLYKFRKFARRNRGFLASMVGLALIMGIATTVSTYLSMWALREKDNAEASAREAKISSAKFEAINSFLINDLLRAARPSATGPGKDVTVKYALDHAIDKIGSSFEDQPEVELAIRLPLGVTYRMLGHYDEADQQLVQSLELHREVYGNKHEKTLNCRHELARLRQLQGRYQEAEGWYRELAKDCLSVFGQEHEQTIFAHRNLATALLALGEFQEAEKILKEYADICREHSEPDARVTFAILNELAYMLHDLGRYRDAEPVYLEVLELTTRHMGEGDTDSLVAMNNLASVYQDLGKFDEARELFERGLVQRTRIFGEKNQRTLVAKNNMAVLFSLTGEFAKAEKLLAECIRDGIETEGKDHRYTWQRKGNMATNLFRQGKLDAAQKLMQEVIDGLTKKFSAEYYLTLEFKKRLGEILTAKKQFDDSEKLLASVVEARVNASAPWQKIAATQSELGLAMLEQERITPAIEVLEECVETYQDHPQGERLEYAKALGRLGECYLAQGSLEKAEQAVRESHKLMTEIKFVSRAIVLRSYDRSIQLAENRQDEQEASDLKKRKAEIETLQ